jgi:hypothetical protein
VTDDGSRPLSSDEISALTTEVDVLAASLHPPDLPIPLVPRAPWMREEDTRSDTEADSAWHSSSAVLLPSAPSPHRDTMYGPRNLHPYLRTRDMSANYHAVPLAAPPTNMIHPDDWLMDPDADVALPYLRFYGWRAVRHLLADPTHRAVKRGALTSLVKFADETYCVFRNEDIVEAARQLLVPPPLPLPPWRQAQVDALASIPAPPVPWTTPTWGASCTDPEGEPTPYLEHRRGYRTAFIRALDPDHLLRHEPKRPPGSARPPEPDSETSGDD